ncbi:MAG: hypothetical protein Q8P22_01945 [Chloroflexota bacterium]|nr:hypothetical protein [Chloroflexota bacterium]
MSFVITVFVPEAIVMASDSRQFLTIEGKSPDGQDMKVETVASDFAYKTFLVESPEVGVSAFGQSILEGISVESHLRRFCEENLGESDSAQSVATKLVEVMRRKFAGVDTAFHVGGFTKEGQSSVPHVYYCHVGRNEVVRKNARPDTGEVFYGASWGGQPDIIARLVNATHVRGEDGKPQPIQSHPIVWNAMNVQDAIDFAIYAVQTTIDTMRFEARPKNVGGPVDVLVLTPAREFWAQRKKLLGEP